MPSREKEITEADSDVDSDVPAINLDSDSASEGSDGSDNSDHDSLLAAEDVRLSVYRKQGLQKIDPDYASDSSDEETENTIGNVPIEWYNDYPHIGYTVNGTKIMRPAKGDDLDKFLNLMDNKDAWKTVHDKLEGKDVVLSKEELQMLKRIQNHQFPNSDFDDYAPTVEWFTSETEVMPISAAPEPKRRFVPSKWEASKIMKISRAIRAGLIVPGRRRIRSEGDKEEKSLLGDDAKNEIYAMWSSDSNARQNHITAPKTSLPEHMESYNPPAEYLLTPEEEKTWSGLDPQDRPHNFLPHKHSNLRSVPAYNKFIQERFERCLDLYLCPRTIKQKVSILLPSSILTQNHLSLNFHRPWILNLSLPPALSSTRVILLESALLKLIPVDSGLLRDLMIVPCVYGTLLQAVY